MSTSTIIPRTCYPSAHAALQRTILNSNTRLVVLGTKCLYTRPQQRSSSTNTPLDARNTLPHTSRRNIGYRASSQSRPNGYFAANPTQTIRHFSSEREIKPAKYYARHVENQPGLFGDDLFRPDASFVDRGLTWKREQLLEKLKEDPELVTEVQEFLASRFPNIGIEHVYTILSHLADQDDSFVGACLTEILIELEVWPSLHEEYKDLVPVGAKLQYFRNVFDLKWDPLSDGVIGFISPHTKTLHIVAIVEGKLGDRYVSLFHDKINASWLISGMQNMAKKLYRYSQAQTLSLEDFTKRFIKHGMNGGQFLKDLLRFSYDRQLYIQDERLSNNQGKVSYEMDPTTVRLVAVRPRMGSKAAEKEFVKEESKTGYLAEYRKIFGLGNVQYKWVTRTRDEIQLLSNGILNMVRKRLESGKFHKEYFEPKTLEAILLSKSYLERMSRVPRPDPRLIYDVKRIDQSDPNVPLDVFDKEKLSKILVREFLRNQPTYETFVFKPGRISGIYTGSDAYKINFSSTLPCLSISSSSNYDKSNASDGFIDLLQLPEDLRNVIKNEENKLLAKEEQAWKDAGGRWMIAGLQFIPNKQLSFSLMRKDPPRPYVPGMSPSDLLDAVPLQEAKADEPFKQATNASEGRIIPNAPVAPRDAEKPKYHHPLLETNPQKPRPWDVADPETPAQRAKRIEREKREKKLADEARKVEEEQAWQDLKKAQFAVQRKEQQRVQRELEKKRAPVLNVNFQKGSFPTPRAPSNLAASSTTQRNRKSSSTDA